MSEALSVIHSRCPNAAPKLALVLGSGLGGLVKEIENATHFAYSDLPDFPHSTVSSHAAELIIGTLAGVEVAVLAGRVHAYETGLADAMAVPIDTLKGLGAERLILTNAAGSLHETMPPGALMLINDHINLSGRNPLIGVDGDARFANMVDAYDPAWRARAQELAAREGVRLFDLIHISLYYATNFIFTGLAVAVAFHAGLFNIGGEGQAYVAGLGVALVCLLLDRIVPWWITAPFALAAGVAFGALWAFVPGYLQAKRGSHIVITTIMFNFIAAALMTYMLVNVLRPDGSMSPQSRTFEEGGRIPRLDWLFEWFGGNLGGSQLNISFFLALVAAFGVWVLIWRTRLGYRLRTLGQNPTAAVYAGMRPARLIMIAMAISGGLAGMMAINEIMGVHGRLLLEFAGGAGFVGIAVALMGRGHPIGIVLAALRCV